MSLILAAVRLLVAALLGSATLIADRGLATRFGDPGDPLDGEYLSCTRQPMAAGQMACAHRTLPCGTVVMLANPRTKKVAVCQVLDRGPFGAILPTGDWGFKLSKADPGDWRGIIDLSPAVADALDFNGRERMNVIYQKVARHTHVGRALPIK